MSHGPRIIGEVAHGPNIPVSRSRSYTGTSCTAGLSQTIRYLPEAVAALEQV